MNRLIVTLMVLCTGWISACADDYYADGGTLDSQVGLLNVSTMDYLKSQPGKFDTLTTLIQMCGLTDEVNKRGNTFLAPQDYSIHNYFSLIFPDGAWPALSAITPEQKEEIAAILKNYIIPNQEVVRESLSTSYSYSTTSGGKKARFNLVREDYLENVNLGAAYLIFSLDVSEDGASRELYQSATIVTSGLKSTNGIVHVLVADTHIFGFN